VLREAREDAIGVADDALLQMMIVELERLFGALQRHEEPTEAQHGGIVAATHCPAELLVDELANVQRLAVQYLGLGVWRVEERRRARIDVHRARSASRRQLEMLRNERHRSLVLSLGNGRLHAGNAHLQRQLFVLQDLHNARDFGVFSFTSQCAKKVYPSFTEQKTRLAQKPNGRRRRITLSGSKGAFVTSSTSTPAAAADAFDEEAPDDDDAVDVVTAERDACVAAAVPDWSSAVDNRDPVGGSYSFGKNVGLL
jgi:hypothetical protein